jgi:hypothetical protein
MAASTEGSHVSFAGSRASFVDTIAGSSPSTLQDRLPDL